MQPIYDLPFEEQGKNITLNTSSKIGGLYFTHK